MPVSIDVDLGAPAAATISSDGMLTIPKDAVALTTDALDPEPVPGTAISRVDVFAVSDLIGWIDTNSGVMTLQGDLIVLLSGPGLDNCPIGPTPVVFATTNDDGHAYDPDTASATVTTSREFGIPAIETGAFGCTLQEPWINAALGLGVPGASSILVDVRLTAPSSPPPPPPPSPPASGGTGNASPPAASPTPPANAGTSPTAPRPAAPKATTKARAQAAARSSATTAKTAAPTTPTTAHVWPTDDTHDLLALPPAQSEPPTTFGRTPIAAEFPVVDDSADGTSLGIGVLVASLGAAIAGFVLLRSEARKLFRRRPHAAF